MMMVIDTLHPLYANVTALRLSSQGHLRFDGNTVSLHMVMEDRPFSASLQDEHDVVFYPGRLRYMPRIDAFAFTHPTTIEPAIDVIAFDYFISENMWPGHEQKPESKFTQAQVSKHVASPGLSVRRTKPGTGGYASDCTADLWLCYTFSQSRSHQNIY